MQVITYQCPYCNEEVWKESSIMTTKNHKLTGPKNHCRFCGKAITKIRELEWDREEEFELDTHTGMKRQWVDNDLETN